MLHQMIYNDWNDDVKHGLNKHLLIILSTTAEFIIIWYTIYISLLFCYLVGHSCSICCLSTFIVEAMGSVTTSLQKWPWTMNMYDNFFIISVVFYQIYPEILIYFLAVNYCIMANNCVEWHVPWHVICVLTCYLVMWTCSWKSEGHDPSAAS